MRISRFGGAALALLMIGGCSPRPSTPAPPASQPASSAVPAQSASSRAGIAWEPYLRLGGMIDMVHGNHGWVALGECQSGSCDEAATLWHSDDLEAWATIELPRSGDIEPISVSATADGYLIGAYDYDELGSRTDAFIQIWRSFDGQFWERVGELRLGACTSKDVCPGVRGVGLAPDGSYVVAAVIQRDEQAGPSYVSDDGFTWRETTIATFADGQELEEVRVQSVESTPDDLFLVGQACAGICDMTVWSTTDGEHWVEEQGFATGMSAASVASDSAQRVAAVSTCSASLPAELAGDCTTDVFTGVRSTAWTDVAPALDLGAPELVWTGKAFVLVGVRDQQFVSYVSADGLTWTEAPGFGRYDADGCGRPWLAGEGSTIIFAVPECSIWQGTVQAG